MPTAQSPSASPAEPSAGSRPDPAALFERFLGRGDHPPARLGRLDAAVVFGFFLLLLAVYFGPLLGPGVVLSSGEGDIAVEWWWKRGYLGEALRAGRIPLWNPHSMAGTPFMATVVVAVFYPLNWLFAVLPTAAVLNGQILFHFWLGMTAMYGLVRRLGRTPWAAFVAAVVFGFTGHAVLRWWAGHLQVTSEWAYVPLALLAWIGLHSARSTGGRSGAALALAALLALQLFAGHPQIVYYTLLVLGGVQAGWLVWAWRQGALRAAVGTTGWLAGAAAGAALLTAVQTLPARALTAESVRGGAAPFAYYEAHSQPLSDVVTAFAPWAFGGRPGGPSYAGTESYWEVTAFLTVTGCLLVLAALFLPRRLSPFEWTCLAGLVAAWVLAWGGNTPLYRVAFDLVPGFSLFRNPGRFLLIVTFLAALLAAAGFDRLAEAARHDLARFRRAVKGLALFLAAGALAGGLVFSAGGGSAAFLSILRSRLPNLPPGFFTPEVAGALFASFERAVAVSLLTAVAGLGALLLLAYGRLRTAGRVLVCLLVLGEALHFAWPYRASFRPADLAWPAQLRGALASDGNLYRMASARRGTDFCQAITAGVRHVWGYETAASKRYGDMIMTSQGAPGRLAPMMVPVVRTTPLTRALGTRHLLAGPGTAAGDPAWRRVAAGPDYTLFEDPRALPRVFVVPFARTAAPDLVARDVNAADFQPTATVILEEPLPPGAAAEPAMAGAVEGDFSPPGRVRVLADEPERFEARLEMERPGWFVLMDQMMPGWTARLDGSPLNIHRANGVGRAMYIPTPGSHRISMTYSAPGFGTGAAISAAAWLVWLAAVAVLAVRGRSGRRPAAPAALAFLAAGLMMPSLAGAEPLRVMTFNLWFGGDACGLERRACIDAQKKAILDARADVVGLQEQADKTTSRAEVLAKELGWNCHLISTSRAVISRFPLEPVPVNVPQPESQHRSAGKTAQVVRVTLPSGKNAVVGVVHLAPAPYGPYEIVKGNLKNADEAQRNARHFRLPELESLMVQIAPEVERRIPAIVLGDFNEPSCEDWTTSTVTRRTNPEFAFGVDWPC